MPEGLTSLVLRRPKNGRKWLALVLNWLSYAGMRDVVVMAKFTERIPPALQLAIRTDRRSAVATLCDGRLAAQHPDITVTRYKFNLTMHSPPPRKPVHKSASQDRRALALRS
jgi:hypothetical protein